MRIGVVDIGSNTARLLVADVAAATPLVGIAKRRSYLGLGAEIARTGRLERATVERAAMIAGAYAARARVHGADAVRTVVTAPGRQGANAAELVAALERGTAAPVRVLTPDEEGALAFDGVVHTARLPPNGSVAVVDVGGGSTEIAVGAPARGADWLRSLDIGSQRLAHLALGGDPPSRREIKRARDLIREALDGLDPPRPDLAFATGGSARAAGRIVGRELTEDDLDEVVRIASRRPSAKLAKTFKLHPHRARTVLAGAILLSEASRSLGLPLRVSPAGMREGAALTLAGPAAAAA